MANPPTRPTKPKGRSVFVGDRQWNWAKRRARRTGQTVSRVVRDALRLAELQVDERPAPISDSIDEETS